MGAIRKLFYTDL